MRIEETRAEQAPPLRRRGRRRGRASDETPSAREGDRPLERRRHLRRQGHREPVLEVRPARPRFPLPPVRRSRPTAGRCGRRRPATAIRRAPPFGHAQRIYNVIDSRQMYLQALLSQALRTLGHPTEAENSIHFSYEMVALSHATARELGYQIAPESDDAKKPFVEVSGRKGLGVKIDDLLDLLTDKASARSRRSAIPSSPPPSAAASASQIAVAAIRYFMLKFSRGKLIVFDIEEALSFEGETGPYLQYAVVRANNILHKLQRARRADRSRRRRRARRPAPASSSAEPGRSGRPARASGRSSSRRRGSTRSSNRSSGRSNSRCWRSTRSGSRRLFNAFYHRYPILNEEDAERKRWRAAGVVVLPRAADARARSDGD